ncbi:hypothetical protein AB0L63_23355 [Nocardia sp. NPDC051990]|uniref:hypothetical protein n=1 Tax=Nocardia sp. NPDC051990 TaxID=3155285 RepID=UPI0034209F5C
MSARTAAALDTVLGRVADTHEQVGDRFPLYADSRSGEWVSTARGAWTGGFWAGLLWLRALRSGSEIDRATAAEVSSRLASWVAADTSTRGLIFWYATALAAGRGADAAAAELRDAAARACAADFDHELGVLPWGSAFGGPRLLARMDGVAGLLPLLAASKAPSGLAAARRHIDTHLARWRAEPMGTPAWEWTNSSWVPCPQPRPGWSRGRAWLLLGLADATWHVDPDYRYVAEELIDYESPLIPAAETVRSAPPDTSAAAIEAVALLKLAAVQRDSYSTARLRSRATDMIENLVTIHLSDVTSARPAGMLLDGCYDLDRGSATEHELVWGDYFLALALAIHIGLVGPFDT